MKTSRLVPEAPYLIRYLAYAIATKARQSVFDFRYFPFKVIRGENEDELEYQLNPSIGKMMISHDGLNQSVDELMKSSNTLSFIVLKDGKVAYEYNAGGITGHVPMLTHSITQSIFASYLSILEKDGVISFSDKMSDYYPCLPPFVGKRTFQSLMNMESGIRFDRGNGPFRDKVKFWLTPDIGKCLNRIRPSSEGTGFFYHNDIHLHLLSVMVDCRISDLSVDINHHLWQYLKPTSDAIFCMDSMREKNLKMDGGMAISSHDLAKFGLLYANGGSIYGNQILSEEWCNNIKSSEGARTDLEYWSLYKQMKHEWYSVLQQGRTYYKNFWWGIKQDSEPNDIYAMGPLGQFVYISTQKNVVIIRQANKWGTKSWWPYILEELAWKL